MGVAGGRPAVSLCARHRISRQVLGSHHPYVSGAPLPGVGRAGPRPQQRPRACPTTGESLDTTWRRWQNTGTCARPSASAIPAAVTPRSRRPRCARAPIARCCLLDPTIFPPEYYGTEPLDAAFTLRRRNVWASPDEMFERFKGPPALCPLAAGDPARLLRVRRAAARRAVRTRLPARRGGIYL